MTRSTRAPKVSRTPTGHDQPDDGPTAPTDRDADTIVAVAHWHGHTPDLHVRGADPHYMREDGKPEFGSWDFPDTVPYELVDESDYLDDHRHDGTATAHHEQGREPHRHAPLGGHRLPIETTDQDAEEDQTRDTDDPAEGDASQARHPSGIDPADPYQQGFQAGEQATRQELANGDRADPAAIERSKETARAASARLADVPTPQPPAIPVSEGVSRPGTSIAHPGALNLLNTVHHVKDDGLNHEMTWLSILLPLAVEIATYHADNRDEGGTGPELAPMELLMRTRDAMEHIVLPRLAREGRP